MKTLLLAFVLIASPAFAQPGVVNGYLVDPQAYVGSLVEFGGYVPRELLAGELARIRPALNACGLHLQNEERGDYRARIFPSETNFERYVDFYDWSGSQRWVWIDHLGSWAPIACANGRPEPAPTPAPSPQPVPPVVTPPLVIDTAAVVAAIDRNTEELKSIHQDAKNGIVLVLKWTAEHVIPPALAAIATWQVAK
jgi:hypothetical protein